MIRLIISDIDGTLLPEGSTELNPEYIDVIRELTDKGVYFAAASGRQSGSVNAVFHELREKIFYLADNGAYIEKYGVPMKENHMNPEYVRALLKELEEMPECYVLVSVRDGYYTEITDPDFLHLIFEEYKGTGGVTTDIISYADRCIKMSIYCKNGSENLYDTLYERWGNRVSVNISGEKWIDVNDFLSTKGNAVEWMQKELAVTPSETMIFGDNYNDISMLEKAEHSYASVLSNDTVKRAARYEVASYEEDGVLQVLKKVLEEMENEN